MICDKINAYAPKGILLYRNAVAISYYKKDPYTTIGYSGYSITVGDTTTEYTTNEGASENKIGMNEGKAINSAPVVEINHKIYIQATDRQDQDDYFLYNFTYTIYSVQNKYRTKLWTVTDCVNRVLELAKPLYGDESPRYHVDGVRYSNGQITGSYKAGSQAEKYDKILAPEFTMTEVTLR